LKSGKVISGLGGSFRRNTQLLAKCFDKAIGHMKSVRIIPMIWGLLCIAAMYGLFNYNNAAASLIGIILGLAGVHQIWLGISGKSKLIMAKGSIDALKKRYDTLGTNELFALKENGGPTETARSILEEEQSIRKSPQEESDERLKDVDTKHDNKFRNRPKDKITFIDFASHMIYPATTWQRDDDFKKIIQDAIKDNPDKTNRIYIEITAFQYWLQQFIIQVALKKREEIWKIADIAFRKVWIRFCHMGETAQAGCDLLKSEFPNMQISPYEYAQILTDRTEDYDKAFTEERKSHEIGESWPLCQVATDLCQNLYMGKDSKIILSLFTMIGFNIKYSVPIVKEYAEQYDLVGVTECLEFDILQ